MRASDFDWRNKTIMVVEDVETNLMFVKAALGKTGINIIWAKDGFEAIKNVQDNQDIHMILMDIRMPNLDGFRATEVIKNIRKDIPIVAQTTFTDDLDKDRILAAGCDDFLAKPIRLEALLSTINKYI